MRLTIDNLDGIGARDYTGAIDAEQRPRVQRKLNRPAQMRFHLLADSPQFVVPATGARVRLERAVGTTLFTGYISVAPDYEYLGWRHDGPVYRYSITAVSDEYILDLKTMPVRPAFIARSAGDILRALTTSVSNSFDLSTVSDLDVVPRYASSPQKSWSEQAAELATLARASYRVQDDRVYFTRIGQTEHPLAESSATFSPEGLKLHAPGDPVNDVTITGLVEPQAHVKDYFLGDGLTLRFPLSATPFSNLGYTLFDEEYGGPLDPLRWILTNPNSVLSVGSGKLSVNGSGAVLRFAELIELGGAVVLQHGEVEFNAASTGMIGGLYNGTITPANCIAGFSLSPSGTQTRIAAFVNGVEAAGNLTTQTGHRYALTTCIYADETYRQQQIFHSSDGTSGGATIASQVRVVLEVHDIDPANPGTQAAASTILYEGTITNAPSYCTYAALTGTSMHCGIRFTRVMRSTDAQVRSTLPGQASRTRLIGSLSEGAECSISETAALGFHSPYVPAPNETICVSYRSGGRAMARVVDPESAAACARPGDDGVRVLAKNVTAPAPLTSGDCYTAARALLADTTQQPWSGQYECWSDMLPGSAADVFPGDTLAVTVPSRQSAFRAIVREVEIETADLTADICRYKMTFANESAAPIAFEFEAARLTDPIDVTGTINAPASYLADLRSAVITQITSTEVTIDTGVTPPAGGGIEVRRSDRGWGLVADRNLVGRFSTRTFTIPRLSRVNTCYLRQYSAGTEPHYSQFSTVLHVDYPL